MRSVSSSESCRSCNEYKEGKYSWGLQPEGLVLHGYAGGIAQDTSVHIRESICALAQLKPISTLHPLFPKREPHGHTTTKCQGAVLVFTGLREPYSLWVSHALIMQCLSVDSNYKSLITDSDSQNVYFGPSYSY